MPPSDPSAQGPRHSGLLLLCGAALRDEWNDWIYKRLLERRGFCDLCGKQKETAAAIACPACLEEFEEMDREADVSDLMDADVNGDPS